MSKSAQTLRIAGLRFSGFRHGISYFLVAVLLCWVSVASAVTVDVASGEQGVATDITTGSDGLTKTGSGTLQIWSAQPYTGATVISAGQIMLAGSGAISASSALQLASGASIHLTGYYAPADINRTFAGLTGAGILYGGGGTVTINKASGSDSFSGNIQGGQGLIKSGGGTLVLSGANTYTGGTLVSAGTLQFNSGAVVAGGITNNASLVYNFTSDEGMNNTISGTGSLTKTGAGVLYLYGEGSTYTGATLINQGRLAMSGGGGGLSSNSAVQMVAGTVLDLAGPWAPASVSRTFAGLSGAGTVTGNTTGTFTINKALGSSDTFAGTIIGTVALNKAGAGTLVLSGANTYTGGTLISGGTLDLNGGSVSGGITNNANLVIRSDMANVVSGTGSLTKEGSAIAALWNPNSYTGATVVNSGQLMLAGSGAISQSSTLQIASGASVRLTGYFAAADINRTFAGLTGAGILYGSGGTVTINKASGSDTFSGDIQGGQGLIKTGAGTLVLSGPNSYTGATMVSGGELVISKASFTATITPVTISVTLSNIPSGGATFAILPGSLSGTYGNPTVNNLGQGQTASFDASTGILSILQGPTGPTFEDAYPGGGNMTDIAPNGLTYLVNYAFGGSSTNPANLPMQDTSDPSKLTLVAYVRTNNASGTLNVVGEKGATLDSWDTNNPIAGVAAQDQSDAPSGTQKRIFSTTNSGDRLFLRLKTTLQP
jgi:autotransporter-associated beta strand protein